MEEEKEAKRGVGIISESTGAVFCLYRGGLHLQQRAEDFASSGQGGGMLSPPSPTSEAPAGDREAESIGTARMDVPRARNKDIRQRLAHRRSWKSPTA